MTESKWVARPATHLKHAVGQRSDAGKSQSQPKSVVSDSNIISWAITLKMKVKATTLMTVRHCVA